MAQSEDGEAYCTLVMSDAYLPGAMVLARSLKDSGTKKALAALVTLDTISRTTLDELKTCYDQIIPVNRLTNRAPANLYLMDRPDLSSAFTKIALWKQTQFTRIVYIDADVVALRATDELFHLPYTFAAAPDVGWPDCFNSGVMLLKPNMGDYYAMLALAQRGISFDGADQGLLNMHFRDWDRLSFTYNCTPSANYQYVPAYRHFQSGISLVHFIGKDKPWLKGRHGNGGYAGAVYDELIGRWWSVYDKYYHPTAQGTSAESKAAVHQYVVGDSQIPSVLIHEAKDTSAARPKVDPAPRTGTIARRPFSNEWDPLHHPPPLGSRPEAANFSTGTYAMSQDSGLFRAPHTPTPPRNVHFEMPQSFEPPKPIFPWEGRVPKAARSFAEDEPQPSGASNESTGTQRASSEGDETGTSATTGSAEAASNFSMADRNNAWDEMPEIERYIASLPQNRRAQVQVLTGQTSKGSEAASTQLPDPFSGGDNDDQVTSPLSGPGRQGMQHRPSLKLTDFPTEIERPSLPVTPAPVHRPSLWDSGPNPFASGAAAAAAEGVNVADHDPASDNGPSSNPADTKANPIGLGVGVGVLPAAEGVPDQSEWDPQARLAELQRRQSEVLEKGTVAGLSGSSSGSPSGALRGSVDLGDEGGRKIPERKVPQSSIRE